MDGSDPGEPDELVRVFVSHRDGHVEVVVRGELDLGSALALEGRLARLIAARTGDVSVDMADLAFLGSTGVRVLADAHRRLEEDGRRLVLRNVCGAPRRTLELVGLIGVLHLA